MVQSRFPSAFFGVTCSNKYLWKERPCPDKSNGRRIRLTSATWRRASRLQNFRKKVAESKGRSGYFSSSPSKCYRHGMASFTQKEFFGFFMKDRNVAFVLPQIAKTSCALLNAEMVSASLLKWLMSFDSQASSLMRYSSICWSIVWSHGCDNISRAWPLSS